MRVLVLGVSGMLGNAIYRRMAQQPNLSVFGTVRASSAPAKFGSKLSSRVITQLDVLDLEAVRRVIKKVQPEVVINCVGMIKQRAAAQDPLATLPINSLLPHQLARLCLDSGIRLVHFSTDCVFSGVRGNYREEDFPDANDLYGRSKLIGEPSTPNAVTLRTSIIGHELNGMVGLVSWFLSQRDICKGYTRAVFSGLPTVVLAKIVQDVVLPNLKLSGLYHVSADPISKFDLLKLIANVYGKKIHIEEDSTIVLDRSLNSEKFQYVTGYRAPEWRELVQTMFEFK
jgi:dTDP-4-dehydrorhamnose reductase